MKNIYEDPSNRNDAQDIMSSSAQDSSKKESVSSENAAPSMPALQLTPEQISALVAQLVSARPEIVSDMLSSTAASKPKEEPKEAPRRVAVSKSDPGKKIVFQSDDFEESASERTLPAIDDEADDLFAKKEENPEYDSFWSKKTERPVPDFSQIDFDEEEGDFGAAKVTLLKDIKNENEDFFASSDSSISVEDFDEDDTGNFEIEKKPMKKADKIRLAVLAVAVVAIVVSGVVLLREFKLSKNNKELEAAVSELIVTTQKADSAKGDKNKNEKPALSAEQQWNEIRTQYPNIIFPPRMQLKYAKLYATNSDFVGYLSADGINMSLPVVQAMNDEIYLQKNFYGQTTKYGCPFVSYLNNILNLDQNTVIFGHHMNDKTIFGALDAYKTLEGYKKAPVISFNTLYKDYKWKVVAAFITNAELEDDNGYVFQYYFTKLKTQQNFKDYLDEISKRSLYDTGVDVSPSDKLLTLSTCSYEFTNARLVVVARLVRSGESAKVNTDNATVNGNPKYPQAYYTKTRKENPYKNDMRWYIQ